MSGNDRNGIAKAIARAWTDADYKARLKSEPHAALAEVGIEVPKTTDIKVVEDTADTRNIVLPATPDDMSDMSLDELEKIAAGVRIAVYKKPYRHHD